MNINNKSTRKLNWKHLFLMSLHLLVFVLSTLSQAIITTKVAARTLP